MISIYFQRMQGTLGRPLWIRIFFEDSGQHSYWVFHCCRPWQTAKVVVASDATLFLIYSFALRDKFVNLHQSIQMYLLL